MKNDEIASSESSESSECFSVSLSLGWLVHNITKSQKVEGAENWSAIISKLCIYFLTF